MLVARRVLLNVVYALLTGYLLCYYSEWMFWSGRALHIELGDYLFTWLAYSFLAYLFLLTVRYFRVHTVWTVFLAGAVYGWLGEGVLVQTMYDDFPFNISITGLSWHALISVLCGWHFLRQALRQSARQTIFICTGLGLYYGFWSSGWWVESVIADPLSQLLYNMGLGALLVAAYAGLERLGEAVFRPTRVGIGVALILTLSYFALVTVPTQPLALFIFPPTMGFVLLILNHNRKRTPSTALAPTPSMPNVRFLIVFLIPLIASLVYAINYAAGFPLSTLSFFYLTTLPAGFLMLLLSVYHIVRSRTQNTNAILP